MNDRFLDFVDDTWKSPEKNEVSEQWIKLGFSEQLVANCSPKFNEFCLEQRTKSPLDIDYYYQQLENSIQKFQEYLLSEVQQELSFFKRQPQVIFFIKR